MQNKKRILSVKVVRAVDTYPDTSYLGEYGNTAKSDYAIDRAHNADCNSLEINYRRAVDTLEHAIGYLNDRLTVPGGVPEVPDADDLSTAMDTLTALQDECMECDCGRGGRWSGREYRYFNPCVEHYKGDTEENIRKYCLQDYERMESLNNEQWCYIGVYVTSEVQFGASDVCQTIRSGGLGGIESYSDKSYIDSIVREELADLKRELRAVGFSTRAISAAFKDREEVDE